MGKGGGTELKRHRPLPDKCRLREVPHSRQKGANSRGAMLLGICLMPFRHLLPEASTDWCFHWVCSRRLWLPDAQILHIRWAVMLMKITSSEPLPERTAQACRLGF